jgi:hypothetical protein
MLKTFIEMFFLVIFLLLALECQNEEEGIISPTSLSANLNIKVGDYFVYDNWALDANMNKIDSTKAISTRTVAKDSAAVGGVNDAYLLVDSLFRTDGAVFRIDTLYMRLDSHSDLHAYGIVYHIFAAQGLAIFKPQWDNLVAFTSGYKRSWTIAATDTIFGSVRYSFTVLGRIEAKETLLAAGKTIPAYRVKVSTLGTVNSTPISIPDNTFWFSENPSAQIRFFRPTGISMGTVSAGQVQELNWHRVGG